MKKLAVPVRILIYNTEELCEIKPFLYNKKFILFKKINEI